MNVANGCASSMRTCLLTIAKLFFSTSAGLIQSRQKEFLPTKAVSCYQIFPMFVQFFDFIERCCKSLSMAGSKNGPMLMAYLIMACRLLILCVGSITNKTRNKYSKLRNQF